MHQKEDEQIFSGNINFFYTFDVGEDINLKAAKKNLALYITPRELPSYLRSYHKPLTVELKSHNGLTKALYANIHHFGVISTVYQIPFKGTLESLREKINDLHAQYQEQSIDDVHQLFLKITSHVSQPKFFHKKNHYLVIQIDPKESLKDSKKLREQYGALIASTLRFEKTTLSEQQVEDILESATGYYREDLVVIDTEAAFVYDKSPEELFDFFELALIQQVELQYFDDLLDNKLDAVYQNTLEKPSWRNCLPFIGTMYDAIGELSKMKVDISVITERLGNTIKTGGEAYYSEIYNLLVDTFELNEWHVSIEKKLAIIRDVKTIYQSKVNAIREDMFSLLITILIFVELLVGIFK
ncbi:hypothetical protein K9K77_02120 [Candidatus Babeliales bacterium]|nr:hypothetical protein [Candidatus Babeliales bacterium]